MTTIRVIHNASEVSKALGRLAYREVPYATARALNALAADVRDEERRSLARSLTVRSRRVPQAVRIVFAHKNRRPIRSQVGILSQDDAFLALHATGGTKRPAPGRRFVAVPTGLVRRGGTGKVLKSQKPGTLLGEAGKRRGFHVKEGRSLTIEQRLSKRQQRTRLGRLGSTATWYLLRARVEIPKRWPFEKTARTVAQLRYQQHFNRWLFIGANETASKVRIPREFFGPRDFHGPRLTR